MAYIQPSSTICLLENTGLDPEYKHTYYFADKTTQADFFLDKLVQDVGVAHDAGGGKTGAFFSQYYQRVNKNRLRLQACADYLRQCDYMMFRNDHFSDKWFYAFVTKVEYVSNVVTEIEYSIDNIQTWITDIKFEDSFVEREHVNDDTFGLHTIPENFELGEYCGEVFDLEQTEIGDPLNPLSIVVAAPFDSEYNPISGTMYGGNYSGVAFHPFNNTPAGIQACIDFITGAGSQQNGIIGVFLMPSKFVTQASGAPMTYRFNVSTNLSNVFKGPYFGGDTSEYPNSYKPHNNKLYTYPFNFLQISNKQGTTLDLRFESFDVPNETQQAFSIICDYSMKPTAILSASDYGGSTHWMDYSIALTNFPQLPFTTDTFKAYLAMTASDTLRNIGQSAFDTVIAFTGGVEAGTASAIAGVDKLIRTGIDVGIQTAIRQNVPTLTNPNKVNGTGAGMTYAYYGLLNFTFTFKHIKPEYAKIIDNYFDMYGYKINQVKSIDLMNSRPHWCYHKTIGCNISGKIPTIAHTEICNAFDNGITFWKGESGTTIHDYSQNNTI